MGRKRPEQSSAGNSSHWGWMPEGRHGHSDRFKPSYRSLRAYGRTWRSYQLLAYRGNVRPRPLLVIINSSSVFGSKLHRVASTNSCGPCSSHSWSSCGHLHTVFVIISVATLPSASRDAGIQGRLSQFVSRKLMFVCLTGATKRRRDLSFGFVWFESDAPHMSFVGTLR